MEVSIVVPLYNEEASLPEFHGRLTAAIDALPHAFDIWYVNDGSRDQTEAIVTGILRRDDRVHLLNLSRNFGHQAALTAGVDFATGDVVITMDGDGQHPPELIGDLLDLHGRGFDLVLTQRTKEREGAFKNTTSWLFYRLIHLLGARDVLPAAADFRLMSREVVEGFRHIRESHRFIRGLVAWMGFRSTVLQFQAAPRIAGKSKYGARKMMRLAYEAIFSFGTGPIRFSILLGLVVLLFAFLQFLDPLVMILSGRAEELVPGWTTLIISVLVLGATQVLTLAIVGQYVGLIYEEVKRRPLYLLRGRPLDRDDLPDEL